MNVLRHAEPGFAQLLLQQLTIKMMRQAERRPKTTFPRRWLRHDLRPL